MTVTFVMSSVNLDGIALLIPNRTQLALVSKKEIQTKGLLNSKALIKVSEILHTLYVHYADADTPKVAKVYIAVYQNISL